MCLLMPVPGWMRGRGGQPETYCHRQRLDAIRYLVFNGVKWRFMPADFPSWGRVYAFFRRWRDHVLVKEFHDRLRGRVRGVLGRDAEPTAGVIDSQSVKADAVVGSDSRGFDGGKLTGADVFVAEMPGWFRLDRTEGQEHALYGAAEKDTLRGQLTGRLADAGIPVLVVRGFGSQPYADVVPDRVTADQRDGVLLVVVLPGFSECGVTCISCVTWGFLASLGLSRMLRHLAHEIGGDLLRASPVQLPSGVRYRTVVDDDVAVVPESDAFLRHVRFGRDQAELTTCTYAGHIALSLRWCIRTARDRPVAAEELGLFVVWLKFGPKAVTGIEPPSGTGLVHPGRGADPVREPARIRNVLTGVRQFLLHGITTKTVPSSVTAQPYEVAESWDLPGQARVEDLTDYRMRRATGSRSRARRASGPPAGR
ncbi:transposase [Streptomyces sp. NPDC057963]|uniref:transposase n=1 Tax=Streptomyces sp. NPDC057963 TaxID=3346290 RepID=UPI0036EA6E04